MNTSIDKHHYCQHNLYFIHCSFIVHLKFIYNSFIIHFQFIYNSFMVHIYLNRFLDGEHMEAFVNARSLKGYKFMEILW
jgi:hypothetical protein